MEATHLSTTLPVDHPLRGILIEKTTILLNLSNRLDELIEQFELL
jgi:hypothetical protein